MKKIIELLNKIFAPRVTYYYNDKIGKPPNDIMKKFEAMGKKMDEMGKLMNSFWD